jgi:repressor LexA
MRQITNRQAEVLIFIENFIQENSYSPTVREIGEHFKFAPKAAHDHITALLRKGCITCQSGKPRTIKITAKNAGVDP